MLQCTHRGLCTRNEPGRALVEELQDCSLEELCAGVATCCITHEGETHRKGSQLCKSQEWCEAKCTKRQVDWLACCKRYQWLSRGERPPHPPVLQCWVCTKRTDSTLSVRRLAAAKMEISGCEGCSLSSSHCVFFFVLCGSLCEGVVKRSC